MSWSIDLKSDRKIPPRSVETALLKIEAIDERDSSNEWGWTCRVDVSLPVGKTLTLSGADFSADDAENFANDLAAALRKLHYKISIGNLKS